MITEAGERLLAALDGLPAKPLDVARKFVLAIEAEAVAAERARIAKEIAERRTAAGMPWPARCVEGDLVTEDPDAYETEDDEMLPDNRRCLTGGSHRWVGYHEAVLAIVNPEEAEK